ncbi:NAD(P)/FAD-dependent oxidoreductase, partial [Burkholderia contaminans]|uniref:NAD(P)/FAD-dependent oxidoreductase n=1 Tax=Burkholderia contaminans TaxID=488447 RepID=UPI003117388C
MEQMDCVVIGAGVVGLAIARELAARGRETLVLEAADAIGTGSSSRNSEVIHAGLYYPRGSLKATSCVHGRDLLYEFCETHHVPHRRAGKLLVATSAAQVKQLRAIAARAAENGVLDLMPLTRAEAQTLEPALECVEALFSPSTGIVDSHQLMLALLGDAERDGAVCALKSPVESIDVLRGGRFVVRTGGDEPTEIEAACVINSAGLGAQALARRTRGLDPRWVPPLYLARGNYFSLSGRAPFSHLIYPMPDRAGLGVHLTLDLGGQARFGPDVEWCDALRYEVDPARGGG